MTRKTCSKCGALKPIEDFSRCARVKSGRAANCKECHRAYYAARREAQLEKQREYRKANREAIRETQRRWREANRALTNSYSRTFRKRNPGKYADKAAEWRDLNAERLREMKRAWRAANADLDRGYVLARVARLKGASGSHSNRDWLRLCSIWGNCCAYCGERSDLTRDHIIPLSRGGSDFIGNILPACLSCNSSKRDRTIVEWRTRTWRKATADTAVRPILPLSADRAA